MISRQHLTASFSALLFVAFLLPPVAIFSGLAVAPFYSVLLFVVLAEGLLKRAIVLPFNSTIFWVIMLSLWALISSSWAINSDRALMEWSVTFTVILLSIATVSVWHHLRSTQLEVITLALLIAVPLMLLLVTIELNFYGVLYTFFGTRFFHKAEVFFNPEVYDRGACFLALMFWALAMTLSKNIRQQRSTPTLFLVVVGIATLITLGLLKSLSAKVGFVAGIGAMVLLMLLPRFGIRLLQFGIIFLAIAFPILAPRMQPDHYITKGLPPSALHRVFIWQFAGSKAEESPWLGYGFYNSRDIPGSKEMIALPNQSTPLGWVYLPNHPHNSVLQLWLELGLVGLAFYVMAALAALSWMLKTIADPLQRAFMGGMMITYFSISLFAFNLWQEWWVASGLFAFMLMRLYVDGFIDRAPRVRAGRMLE